LAKTVSRVSEIGAGAIPRVMNKAEITDQYLQSICGWNRLIEYQDTLISRGQWTYKYVRPLSKRFQKSARHSVEVLGPHPGLVWPEEFDDDRRRMREEYVNEFTWLRRIQSTTTEDEFWFHWNKWADKDTGKAFQRFKLDMGLPTSTNALCKREGHWKTPESSGDGSAA
jgi:hypothetical protein